MITTICARAEGEWLEIFRTRDISGIEQVQAKHMERVLISNDSKKLIGQT